MPNFIRKVLANVQQSLSPVERQQARDNIGIPRYKKLTSYDPSISSTDDAAFITIVGDFRVLYYHDNQGQLRLLIENIDMGDPHSVVVSSDSTIDIFENVAFGSRVGLSASFTSAKGMHQDLRFIIDGANFGELSIQWIRSVTPTIEQLWYKV